MDKWLNTQNIGFAATTSAHPMLYDRCVALYASRVLASIRCKKDTQPDEWGYNNWVENAEHTSNYFEHLIDDEDVREA